MSDDRSSIPLTILDSHRGNRAGSWRPSFLPKDLGPDFFEEGFFSIQEGQKLNQVQFKATIPKGSAWFAEVLKAEESFKAFLGHMDTLPKRKNRVLLVPNYMTVYGAGSLSKRVQRHFSHILQIEGKKFYRTLGPFIVVCHSLGGGVDFISECRPNLRYKPGLLSLTPEHAMRLMRALEAGVPCEELGFEMNTPYLRHSSETHSFRHPALSGETAIRSALQSILDFDTGVFQQEREEQFMNELRYRLDEDISAIERSKAYAASRG